MPTFIAIDQTMSTNQAQRAGIREGNGNGSNSTLGRVPVNSSNPLMPSLSPSATDIVALLKSQKIVKKDEKYDLVKSTYDKKVMLTAFLAGLSEGASDEFDGLECWKHAFKTKSGYTADVLGQYIFDIRNAIRLILPRSQHHHALSESAKRVVTSISVTYERAKHTATTEIQSKFSSQFVSVDASESDRKYLENGYKPVLGSGLETCICCGHGYTDEPNSNIAAGAENTNKRAIYEAEIAADEHTWANGGTVYTNRGTVMQRGRKRNDPQYRAIFINCHCEQFGCDTPEGPVSTNDCPIRCIDPTTGVRYKFDLVTAECLCPICSCNSCPRFYTVTAHQMYRANSIVQRNGGQADTSNPPSTRHRPPANVTGNYHDTASSLGQMMNRHAHSAVQGALLAAQDSIQKDRLEATLDMPIIEEHMSLNVGREMVESMHGDSAFARSLSAIASASGPPSTFTNLPENGVIFNARNIPACNSQHRQVNNRLEPMKATKGLPSNLLYPPGVKLSSKQNNNSVMSPVTSPPFVSGAKRSAVIGAKKKKSKISQIVDKSIQLHNLPNKDTDPSNHASLPACLDGIDTSFLTSTVKTKRSITPTGSTQMKSSSTIDLSIDSSPEEIEESVNSKIEKVETLIERATRRSFDETGAGTVVNVDSGKSEMTAASTTAVSRVNMICEHREKALHLTEMLMDKYDREGKTVDSPAVNKMLDMFL